MTHKKDYFIAIFIVLVMTLTMGAVVASALVRPDGAPIDVVGNPIEATNGTGGTDATNLKDTPASTGVSVLVNGKKVVFPDQKPYIVNSRTMVPVRFISESLGSKVYWDAKTQTVTIVKGTITIKLKIGQSQASVNGKAFTFDAKAEIKSDRTMVPLRFVSETMGAKAAWDAITQTVTITGVK